MAKHYYYRCDSASEIGKKLKRLLNDCQKAERAQMDFGRKCGAESIVPVDENFEGGVIGVTFADDKQVNRTIWKEIVKDKDGKIIWRPNCEHREGAIVAKSKNYRPSNTATRIYRYQQVGWERVKHLFPSDCVDDSMKDKQYILYTDLYREDASSSVRKMSKQQREAICIEHQRMMLPVVTPQRVFAVLQADITASIPAEKKMYIVQPETPTFWEYDNFFYIGCMFPCRAEGLTEIESEAYSRRLTDLMRVKRDLEAMAKNNEKGS